MCILFLRILCICPRGCHSRRRCLLRCALLASPPWCALLVTRLPPCLFDTVRLAALRLCTICFGLSWWCWRRSREVLLRRARLSRACARGSLVVVRSRSAGRIGQRWRRRTKIFVWCGCSVGNNLALNFRTSAFRQRSDPGTELCMLRLPQLPFLQQLPAPQPHCFGRCSSVEDEVYRSLPII